MDFEVVFFPPIYARKYANRNKSLLGPQTINVGYLYDRQIMPTNYFVDKGKEANFKCGTLHKIVTWFA